MSNQFSNQHQNDSVHEKYFVEQVAEGIAEADDPGAEWVSHEDAQASWDKKRKDFAKRANGTSV